MPSFRSLLRKLPVFFFLPLLPAQQHFVFVNRDRPALSIPAFLSHPAIAGLQVKYTWRELEPQPGRFQFDPIRQDLALLQSKSKKLFIQLQDSSFDDAIVNTPPDLPAARQYDDNGRPAGWVARRWDPATRTRFHQLLAALGAEFDGRIEGINLPETSIGIGVPRTPIPAGFSPAAYREGILANMAALKKAFPKSVAMQYANFMPGEWLPADDHGHLAAVHEFARQNKLAAGSPDLLPSRPGQRNHPYPQLRRSAGIIPTAIAVQQGNYAAGLSVPALHQYARENLKVTYIFWCTEEPFFSRDLLPYLRSLP